MKNNNQSLRALLYLASQLLLQIISVITIPIFTRILTTEEYGVVAIYSTWMTIISYLIGMRTDATISIAKVHRSETFAQYCSITFLLPSTIMFIFVCMTAIFHKSLAALTGLHVSLIIFMIVHAYGSCCVKNQLSIYIINKQTIQHTVVNVGVTLLTVFLSFFLIYLMPEHKDTGRIWGLGIPYILTGLFFCFHAIAKGKILYDRELLTYCLKLSVPLIFGGISGQLLSQSDRIMLSSMRNNSEVGIYAFCYSVANPLTGIWSALGSAWRPDYFENLEARNMDWIKEHSNNYLFLFTSLVCGYLLVCQEAVKILGAQEYWEGISIVPLIVLVSFLEFLYSFPANYEYYQQQTKLVAIGLILASAINIIINFIFIPKYGIMAAAISTVIAYIFLFIIHDIFARKIGNYHYNWNFYIKGIIPVTFCFLYTYIFQNSMVLRWSLGFLVAINLIKHIYHTKALL